LSECFDRLGAREDRFFATVFLGSGLLMLAMLFAAAAVVGAITTAFHAAPDVLLHSGTLFTSDVAYGVINIYLVKAVSVFMITTSTIALYTRLTPRWLALGGYVVAIVLLIGSYYFNWSLLVFPLWVLLVSLSILRDKEDVGAYPVIRRSIKIDAWPAHAERPHPEHVRLPLFRSV